MSELLKTPSDDAFFDHPCAGAFMSEAFESFDDYGSTIIPKPMRDHLGDEFRIEEGEAAALAYLASKRASEAIEEFPMELDIDLKTLSLQN